MVALSNTGSFITGYTEPECSCCQGRIPASDYGCYLNLSGWIFGTVGTAAVELGAHSSPKHYSGIRPLRHSYWRPGCVGCTRGPVASEPFAGAGHRLLSGVFSTQHQQSLQGRSTGWQATLRTHMGWQGLLFLLCTYHLAEDFSRRKVCCSSRKYKYT